MLVQVLPILYVNNLSLIFTIFKVPSFSHRVDNGMSNKSKYIEDLVKKDLENRGENIEPDF